MNPEWLKDMWEKRKLFYQKNLDSIFAGDYEHETSPPDMVETLEEANLRSSWLGDDKHAPALDLDIPHQYIPSSTKGHGHLYLDVELTTEQYKKLLDVLLECGIIEKGFHNQFTKCGTTFLRTRSKGVLTPVEKKELLKKYDETMMAVTTEYPANPPAFTVDSEKIAAKAAIWWSNAEQEKWQAEAHYPLHIQP